MLRADKMIETLTESAPGAEVVARAQGGLPQDGRRSMERVLDEHPEVNVIMSINDAGAFGAAQALREARIAEDAVSIFSVDAEAEARRMIREGEYLRASLDNDPVGTGSAMVDAAVKMLAGSIVPRQVLVSGKLITRDTLITPTPGGVTPTRTHAATEMPVETPTATPTPRP
jgi:ribose transport system substrate-binding protein